MRYAIETAPRDGKIVIVEDDANGTYDVVHWSAEAGEWVGENDEPSKITPTHWSPMLRDKYLLQEHDGSRNRSKAGLASRARRGFAAMELKQARDEAVQQKQTAEAAIADLQQLLQQEQKKTAALTQEVGAARQAMTANAEQQRRALDEAQARAAALASELAGTRREIETQAAQSQKAVEEAGQQKQTAEGAMADLQQLLQQEQKKTAALTEEVGAARQAMTANAEQQRRALDEAQARAAALASELTGTRREIATHATPSQVAFERAANSQFAQATQAVEAEASKQPAAAVSQGRPEVPRLMARASALLGRGNIGGARIVLERAAETGSAQASFALAETYDPSILSAWGTYGTRGDATKARELYAKAHAGGIQEAKDRLNALRQ
jgi:hypothetical protein